MGGQLQLGFSDVRRRRFLCDGVFHILGKAFICSSGEACQSHVKTALSLLGRRHTAEGHRAALTLSTRVGRACSSWRLIDLDRVLSNLLVTQSCALRGLVCKCSTAVIFSVHHDDLCARRTISMPGGRGGPDRYTKTEAMPRPGARCGAAQLLPKQSTCLSDGVETRLRARAGRLSDADYEATAAYVD